MRGGGGVKTINLLLNIYLNIFRFPEKGGEKKSNFFDFFMMMHIFVSGGIFFEKKLP